MALYTYYFALSAILVFGLTFHVTNMLFFRKKHRVLTGIVFKPDAPEYKTLMRQSSRRNLTIVSIMLLVSLVNLGYSTCLFAGKSGITYATVLFISITAVIFAIFVGVFMWASHEYNDANNDRWGK